jgi:hypothetical protein
MGSENTCARICQAATSTAAAMNGKSACDRGRGGRETAGAGARRAAAGSAMTAVGLSSISAVRSSARLE